MLRRIARRDIPALAALLGLLAAFITPPAHAAATYDITQVGKVTSAGLTRDGARINGTDFDGSSVTDGIEATEAPGYKLAIHGEIPETSRLTAGDHVTIPISVVGRFISFGCTWGSSLMVKGVQVGRVSANGDKTAAIITLTDGVKGFTDLSFNLMGQCYVSEAKARPNVFSTTAVLKVSDLSRTLACQRKTLDADWWNGPLMALDGRPGLVTSHASVRLGGVFNRWLDGASVADGDIGYTYTIVPLDVGIKRVDYLTSARFIIGMATEDGKHASTTLIESPSDSRQFTFVAATDKAFTDPTTALGVGEATYRRNADGTWSFAVNLGPFLNNRWATYPNGYTPDDSATADLVSKARNAGTMAQCTLSRFVIHPESTVGEYRFRVDETLYGPYVDHMKESQTTSTTVLDNSASGTRTYSVTYEDTASGATDTVRYTEGSTAILKTPARHDGLTFTGWNTKPDGTGDAYRPSDTLTVTGDTTLYAQWEANTYKTEFRDWQGRTITSGTAKYGTTPTVPALADTTWLADPDMNFDNVDGWRDDWWHGSPTFTKDGLTVNSRDTRANGKTVGANAAIHVEADADYSEANATNAAKSSGIGFNINNGSNSYQGWDACPNGRQCEVDAVLTAGLASSQTIEPWVQIANNQFNGYGTATVHHMQLTQVDPATHNGIARDGYVFTGWDKDPSKPVEGDTVYTAQYRPAVYKIRFDANGGTGTMADQSHTYDRKQALTASAFTREGYHFTGWNTRRDGKGKAFTDKQTVTNLLAHDGAVGVLYAQWKRVLETTLPDTGGHANHGPLIVGGGVIAAALALAVVSHRRAGRHAA